MIKRKVLVVGAYPPPIGGVTMHVARLLDRSSVEGDLHMMVFDIKKCLFFNSEKEPVPFFVGLFFLFSCALVHVHLSLIHI